MVFRRDQYLLFETKVQLVVSGPVIEVLEYFLAVENNRLEVLKNKNLANKAARNWFDWFWEAVEFAEEKALSYFLEWDLSTFFSTYYT